MRITSATPSTSISPHLRHMTRRSSNLRNVQTVADGSSSEIVTSPAQAAVESHAAVQEAIKLRYLAPSPRQINSSETFSFLTQALRIKLLHRWPRLTDTYFTKQLVNGDVDNLLLAARDGSIHTTDIDYLIEKQLRYVRSLRASVIDDEQFVELMDEFEKLLQRWLTNHQALFEVLREHQRQHAREQMQTTSPAQNELLSRFEQAKSRARQQSESSLRTPSTTVSTSPNSPATIVSINTDLAGRMLRFLERKGSPTFAPRASATEISASTPGVSPSESSPLVAAESRQSAASINDIVTPSTPTQPTNNSAETPNTPGSNPPHSIPDLLDPKTPKTHRVRRFRIWDERLPADEKVREYSPSLPLSHNSESRKITRIQARNPS